MNAPHEQHLNATLEQLPISSIRPSPFKAQTLRRSHFSTEKMIELAASIKANGVLQPILVRPIKPNGTTQFEIVAGERRYIAADRAGLGHIPATVRDMTDQQVLEAQLVENLQREGLQALEEAEGYAELMKLSDINADAVADKIGKSRSYVYARLKLLDLIPEARQALQDGAIDASKALLVARLTGDKVQKKALKLATELGYYSYRRLAEKIKDDCMIQISRAPWLPDRDTLHSKDGQPIQDCATCPSRSCNDPELSGDINDADVCTDRPCFDLKTKLHFARLRDDFIAQGKTVITGDDAKQYVTVAGGYMNGPDITNGYVRLDATCDTVKFPEPEPEQGKDESFEAYNERWSAWSAREDDWQGNRLDVLVGDVPGAILVETKKGFIPVAPVEAVTKALKAKKIKVPADLKPGSGGNDDDDATPVDPAKEAAERARDEERRKVEQEYRNRLVKAVHAKYKGPLKQPELEIIADEITDNWHGDVLEEIYPDGIDIKKLKEVDLIRLIVTNLISREADSHHQKPSLTLALAGRLKIDAKKLRAEVVKDLKPVSAPATEEAEPVKTKAKKKGARK